MKSDLPYLADILQALQRVEEVGRRGRDAFFADWLLQDAAIRNFEIVGEATKRLSAALRETNPEIPWVDLAGFRQRGCVLTLVPGESMPLAAGITSTRSAGRIVSRGTRCTKRGARAAGTDLALRTA